MLEFEYSKYDDSTIRYDFYYDCKTIQEILYKTINDKCIVPFLLIIITMTRKMKKYKKRFIKH